MNTTTQCVWFQGILRELGFAFDSPRFIWCDNKSAINISNDTVQIHRNNHIDIHMHYICILVHDQVIALQYFPSAEQTVDIFTKYFTENTFTYMRSLIGGGDTWLWIPFTFIFLSLCPFFRGGFVPMWFSSLPCLYGQIFFLLYEVT